MSLIQVFDPATGCGCASGGCGGGGNPAAADFAADAKWAQQKGARIERNNLALEPMAFAGNPVVHGFLERSGIDALPLVLVNGEIALAGRYPSRDELARWAGLEKAVEGAENCCSGGRCCG